MGYRADEYLKVVRRASSGAFFPLPDLFLFIFFYNIYIEFFLMVTTNVINMLIFEREDFDDASLFSICGY